MEIGLPRDNKNDVDQILRVVPLGVQRDGSQRETRQVPLVVQGRSVFKLVILVVPLGARAQASRRLGDRLLVPLVVQAFEGIATTPLGHAVAIPTRS